MCVFRLILHSWVVGCVGESSLYQRKDFGGVLEVFEGSWVSLVLKDSAVRRGRRRRRRKEFVSFCLLLFHEGFLFIYFPPCLSVNLRKSWLQQLMMCLTLLLLLLLW